MYTTLIAKLPEELRGELATFTHDKEYQAIHINGNAWQVFDDLGVARTVIPESDCPHLCTQTRAGTSAKGQFIYK